MAYRDVEELLTERVEVDPPARRLRSSAAQD
jgi:hypothetical protein